MHQKAFCQTFGTTNKKTELDFCVVLPKLGVLIYLFEFAESTFS